VNAVRSDAPGAPCERESQRWCCALLRKEAKSFYLATRFLPRAKREAVEAIYAVFRMADNLADEPGYSDEERRAGLREIAFALEHVRDEVYRSDAPWFAAVRRAFAAFPIAVADALRLIDACRADLDGVVCETLQDLEAYCAAVAGTVGRCALPILGACDADSLERAERLGIALQLTNVLRDVDRDRASGRSYLPRAFATLSDRGASMIAARAREYYREAAVIARRLPNDGSRLAILLAADLYEATLDGPLTLWERVRRVGRCIVRATMPRLFSGM